MKNYGFFILRILFFWCEIVFLHIVKKRLLHYKIDLLPRSSKTVILWDFISLFYKSLFIYFRLRNIDLNRCLFLGPLPLLPPLPPPPPPHFFIRANNQNMFHKYMCIFLLGSPMKS